MCGHAGYAFAAAATGRTVEGATLERMGDSLAHRGPDDGVVWLDRPEGAASVGAVFRRLSIIDLEGGRQPIPNETSDVVCLVNGEIYNFRELRTELEAAGHTFRTGSDAEVVVHLYEEVGAALAERLVGMFAFAVIDLRGARPKVLLGRDRLGIKPLYFVHGPAGLAWASEPKALLAMGADGPGRAGIDRELRGEALLEYLVRGYVGGTESAWRGVSRLRPGCVLSWDATSGQAHTGRYWDLPLELRGEADEQEVLEWTDRVVQDRLVADVPLGAFLSGGIDSSAVVTSMARQTGEPVIACSVGFQEKSHDELGLAVATAKGLGAVHHTEVLEADPRLALDELPWYYDEPLADPSTVPTFLVSRMAREHVTVALSGDGGDETFGGYRRYLHDQAENRVRRALGPLAKLAGAVGSVYPKLDRAPQWMRGKSFLTNLGADPGRAYFNSVSILSRPEADELLAPELRDALAGFDPAAEFLEAYRRPTADCPLYRAQYADVHTYLTDQILAKVDRASMGVSLEVRVPLLDHRFMERFANLPAHQKIHGGRGKHLLRESQRGRLSSDVLDGKKRGFDTPLDAWLRGPLEEPVRAAVEELPEEWLDRSATRRLLDQHKSGVRNHGRTLWSLFVLERWRRRHGVRGIGL